MTPAELGLRAGIKVRRVKQHLVPARFHRIRLGDLQKYSRVFNIPVANLFQIIVTQSGLNPTYHFYHEDEALRDSIAVKQHRTDNPWMVVAKAGENSK